MTFHKPNKHKLNNIDLTYSHEFNDSKGIHSKIISRNNGVLV